MNEYFDILLPLEFKEAFDIFDKNGDGKICIDEISDIFETFDMETSEEQMHKMMKESDIDGKMAKI